MSDITVTKNYGARLSHADALDGDVYVQHVFQEDSRRRIFGWLPHGVREWLKARFRVHYVYYLLAAFDVMAISTGLYLTHTVNQNLQVAIYDDIRWNALHDATGRIRMAATRAAGPAKDVFSTNDAQSERRHFSELSNKALGELRQFRIMLSHVVPASRIPEATDQLLLIETSLKALETSTNSLLDLFAVNRSHAAAAARSIDQAELALLQKIENLGRNLRDIEAEANKSRLDEAQNIRFFELVLAIALVLMVAAVTFYGHAIGRLIHRKLVELEVANEAERLAVERLRHSNREVRDLNAQLGRFNEELEGRVVERTRELQEANDNITELNGELNRTINDLRDAQDEIIRKSKMAQLGQLTATVAHEIRNPLGAIRTAAYLVERKLSDKSLGVEGQLKRINNGISRCDRIITELLDFARSKALQIKTTPVDDWVRKVVEDERKSLPANVQVAFDLRLGATEASFDLDRMQRVLINLLSNASEAMVGKGNEPAANAPDTPLILVRTAQQGDRIRIEVIDNGPGISPDNMKKILEPLFTTKSFGVGLGLPAVQKILEQHGGALEITSDYGHGAQFSAWFPIEPSLRKAA